MAISLSRIHLLGFHTCSSGPFESIHLRPLVLVPQGAKLPLRIDAAHEHLRHEHDNVDENGEVRQPDVGPDRRGSRPRRRREPGED